MESDYHWLITIGLVTSSVIAVTANFFLLVVFCKRRGLRTVPNRFVINLLITNLLSSTLLIPLLLVDQEARAPAQLALQRNETDFQDVVIENSPGSGIEIIRSEETIDILQPPVDRRLLCHLAQSATSFVCTASIFSILLIGVNQYFGVIHSLRYHFYINRCRSSVLIGASWTVALLCAVLSALTHSDGGLWRSCATRTPPGDLAKTLNTVYAFGYFFLVILAPFVAICAIYVCIYAAAHQNSERMRRSTSAPLHSYMDYVQVPIPKTREAKARDALPKVHSAPNFFNIDRDRGFRVEEEDSDESSRPRAKVARTCSDRIASSFIGNLRHKISNASVFRYREETRAAKISVLVVLMVLVCYIPYGLALVLGAENVRAGPAHFFDYLSLALLVFSNVLSPFLFGYRNKRVKREICKMLGVSARRSETFEDAPRRATAATTNGDADEPFIRVPEVVVTCKPENERKSILKRVCESSGWSGYKKCNFIAVPDSCIGSGEARGSFSSASTQISTEE